MQQIIIPKGIVYRKSIKSNVDWIAEEHEGRCGRVTTQSSTPSEPLVAINAEQRQRELQFVPRPHSLSDSLRVAEPTQHRPDADHVEPLVAAESHNDGSYGGRRRIGHVAEAEVFPERVVVSSESAPETADASGYTEGGTVKSFKDFYEDVDVVVYEELGTFLLVFCCGFLHAFLLLSHCRFSFREREREREYVWESIYVNWSFGILTWWKREFPSCDNIYFYSPLIGRI